MIIVATAGLVLVLLALGMAQGRRRAALRPHLAVCVQASSHRIVDRRVASGLVAFIVAVPLLVSANPSGAAIVPTIGLGTAAGYSVLAGETVTNTGNTTLAGSIGLSPGTEVTGFPPGIVLPPSVIDIANDDAAQAKLDLTAAYVAAATRPVNEVVTADLTGLELVGGVYSGPDKSSLLLTGTLTLDGQGNPNSVFIFQTDSTLTTMAGANVVLINGAQQCNVFWQVGSSATLSGPLFIGTILAQASISLNSGVTVHGRALAQTGSVTLISDTFVAPTCDLSAPPEPTATTSTTTTTTTSAATTTTQAPAGTTTTSAVVGGAELPATGPGQSMPLVVVGMGLLVMAGLALTIGSTRRRNQVQ